MSRPSSRARALLFALLAALCALGSVAFASRYTGDGAPEAEDLRGVVVTRAPLPAGERLGSRQTSKQLEVREVPARYVPPDALSSPAAAIGGTPHATIPAGSYLLSSHLGRGRDGGGDRLPGGLQPIEVAVSGAGALEGYAPGSGGARPLVDVLAADEPGSTINPRVRVLARTVPLLGLDRTGGGGGGGEPGSERWLATLAVSRAEAVAVIEAENFARQVRLLPNGGAR